MKIAIMSDSHDRWEFLEKAIEIANEEGCSTFLFAGDLIAPPRIALLEKFNGEVKFVWGNSVEGANVNFQKLSVPFEKLAKLVEKL
jgi:predicted phosphodiesterase